MRIKFRISHTESYALTHDLSHSLLLKRGGRYRTVNLPSPYFFSQFLPPPFWGNFSLLPKLGLKINGGQHITPSLSGKGSIMTFRACTTRRRPNHHMYAYEDFMEGKPIHPPPRGSTPLHKPYRYVPHQKVGFLRRFSLKRV